MPPVAVIDIGSNTTRLLVAEPTDNDGFRRLLSQRSFTRLGRGLDADGTIPAEKIELLAQTIATQSELARVMGADTVHAFATAATRDAANRQELLDAVERRTAVRIEVLDQREEARLAFLGATHALSQDGDGVVAVIDVGGGSTEIAVGTPGSDALDWSASLRVGSALLTDAHVSHDPPLAEELDALRAAVGGSLAAQEFPAARQAIAIGGSASSLRRLVGNVLEHETLERAVRLVTEQPAASVAEQFGVEPERVQVLPAGMLTLEAIGDRLQLPLRIGKGGVREGKLLELLA